MAFGCYPCTACNECGMFDAVMIPVCSVCEHPMPMPVTTCPQCGNKKVKMIPNPKAKNTQLGVPDASNAHSA